MVHCIESMFGGRSFLRGNTAGLWHNLSQQNKIDTAAAGGKNLDWNLPAESEKLLINQLNIIMQKSTLWSFYRLFFLQRCGSKCSNNNHSNLVFFEKTHANSRLPELPQFSWLSNSFYERPSQEKKKKNSIQAEENNCTPWSNMNIQNPSICCEKIIRSLLAFVYLSMHKTS